MVVTAVATGDSRRRGGVALLHYTRSCPLALLDLAEGKVSMVATGAGMATAACDDRGGGGEGGLPRFRQRI